MRVTGRRYSSCVGVCVAACVRNLFLAEILDFYDEIYRGFISVFFLRRILFARSVVVDVVIDWSAALPQENVNNTTEWTDGISYCCRLLVQSPSAMTLTC